MRVETVETIRRVDCTIELLAYWSEEGVPVPALLFLPSPLPAGRLPAAVYASPEGKQRTPDLRSVHEVLRAGAAVLAIDYRGQGDTAGAGGAEGELPAVERGIMLHRPLFGGRIWDVVRGVEYLASRPEIEPTAVSVWGESDASLLALYAAALDESVAGAACLGLPDSYCLNVGAGGAQAVLAPWAVLPGVLTLADIADIRTLVAPRPFIAGTVSDAADLVPGLTQANSNQ